LFVKAGSVIPLYPSNLKNLQRLSDTVILNVFDGNGTGTLYEDDGVSDKYRNGEFALTRFTQTRSDSNKKSIVISPVQGSYKGMHTSRHWIIKLHKNFPPASVTVNGKVYSFSNESRPGSWAYNGDLETIITLPALDLHKTAVIHITYAETPVADKKLLEGYTGFMKRMPFGMERIKFEISAVDWGAAIPDLILHIESLPVRIQYNPKNTLALLREHEGEKKAMRQVIMSIHDVSQLKLKQIADFLELPE
jgi:hypothetical protein